MAKLLLCHPLFLNQRPDEMAASSPYFPLGLLYLAAYVRQNKHEVAIFDGTFAAGPPAFKEALVREAPDVVGISALMPTRETALELAKVAHDAGVPVIVGGPDPTKDPLAYLAHAQVDVVVHHEGERTIVALLDLMEDGRFDVPSLQEQLGVAFRDASGVPVVRPPRAPIEDLDALPLPARDLIDMERYLAAWRELNGYASLTLTTARGCPYGCEWCRDAVHGQGYRQRSPENVAAEMKALKERYEFDRLRLVDDVDGIDRQWIEAWAEAAASAGAVIPFEALNDLQRQDIPMLDVRDTL